jgi:hypothetical protein
MTGTEQFAKRIESITNTIKFTSHLQAAPRFRHQLQWPLHFDHRVHGTDDQRQCSQHYHLHPVHSQLSDCLLFNKPGNNLSVRPQATKTTYHVIIVIRQESYPPINETRLQRDEHNDDHYFNSEARQIENLFEKPS